MPPPRPNPEKLPGLTWPLVGGLMFVELVTILVIAGLVVLAMEALRPNRNDIADSVRRELGRQVDAWNRGDLIGFLETYWNDDRLCFYSGGDVTTGWNPIRERYFRRYKSEGKEMGKLAFDGPEVVVLSPTEAFVRGRFALELQTAPPQSGLYTLIMRKIDGQWRIVHDHTSADPPPKPPVGGEPGKATSGP
jgi:ketosteroid isomerase-like protein